MTKDKDTKRSDDELREIRACEKRIEALEGKIDDLTAERKKLREEHRQEQAELRSLIKGEPRLPFTVDVGGTGTRVDAHTGEIEDPADAVRESLEDALSPSAVGATAGDRRRGRRGKGWGASAGRG